MGDTGGGTALDGSAGFLGEWGMGGWSEEEKVQGITIIMLW